MYLIVFYFFVHIYLFSYKFIIVYSRSYLRYHRYHTHWNWLLDPTWYWIVHPHIIVKINWRCHVNIIYTQQAITRKPLLWSKPTDKTISQELFWLLFRRTVFSQLPHMFCYIFCHWIRLNWLHLWNVLLLLNLAQNVT